MGGCGWLAWAYSTRVSEVTQAKMSLGPILASWSSKRISSRMVVGAWMALNATYEHGRIASPSRVLLRGTCRHQQCYSEQCSSPHHHGGARCGETIHCAHHRGEAVQDEHCEEARCEP